MKRRWLNALWLAFLFTLIFDLLDFSFQTNSSYAATLFTCAAVLCWVLPQVFLWDGLDRYVNFSIPLYDAAGMLSFIAAGVPYLSSVLTVFVTIYCISRNPCPDNNKGFNRIPSWIALKKKKKKRKLRLALRLDQLEQIEDGIYKQADGSFVAVRKDGYTKKYQRIYYARKFRDEGGLFGEWR